MEERRHDGHHEPHGPVAHAFARFTDVVVDIVGRPVSLLVALVVFGAWFVVSLREEGGQVLLINLLTVLTFLLLFPLQHSQNRDSKALHAKLDELIDALPEARNEMKHIETRDEPEIERMRR